jgi:hypothetical protein
MNFTRSIKLYGSFDGIGFCDAVVNHLRRVSLQTLVGDRYNPSAKTNGPLATERFELSSRFGILLSFRLRILPAARRAFNLRCYPHSI